MRAGAGRRLAGLLAMGAGNSAAHHRRRPMKILIHFRDAGKAEHRGSVGVTEWFSLDDLKRAPRRDACRPPISFAEPPVARLDIDRL
jgi:hypothetical protein